MKKRLVIIISALLIGVPALIYFALPGAAMKLLISFEHGSAGLTAKTVQAGDHSIAYLEGGKGETIVLLHGFGADKDNFSRFSKSLTPRYRVIIPDLPGFGDSTKNKDAKYDHASQAGRLNAFIDKIALRRFHLGGNSMGGCIAALYAAAYPEKVQSLFLIDSSGVTEPEPSEMKKQLDRGNNLLVMKSIDDMDRFMNFVFYKPPFIPGPLKKWFFERAVKNRFFNEKIFSESHNHLVRDVLEPALPKIKVPVLIMWGDKDRVIDVSSVRVFERLLENHTTVILKDCGHLPMLERPGEASQHYLDFLKNAK